MKLKPARLALTGIGAIFLFITMTIAQEIGHLGVSTDPVPLVQARRQRNFIVRVNRNNPNVIAANRSNPGASPTIIAGIDQMPGAPGKGTNTAAKPNQTGLQLPAAAPNSTVLAPAKIDPTAVAAVAAIPATAPKPVASPFEEAVAKAEDLVVKNDARGAVEAYRQALALKPDSLEARLGLADSLQDAKDYVAADAEFKKLTEQNPNSAEARRGRGDSLYELKKYDEAVAEYQAAIKAGANDAGVYNNLGNALFRTGTRENRDLAIENYRKAIERNQTWADAHAGLAYVLRVQRRVNEAQAAVEKALQLAPDSSLAHSVAGRVYADLGDFARANAEAQKAIDLAPKDAFAYLNLAGIQYMQQRFNEAIRTYVTAQSYDRTWAVPHNSLGNLYLSINRPLEAAEEFEIASKLEPKSPIIHGNLGAAYIKLRKYDAAIQNLQLATQLDRNNSNAFSNLGLAYHLQGRYNDAVAAFTRATEIEPNNSMFQQALIDSLNAAGRKKEAKDAYNRAGGKGVKVKKK
ncbi:MAG: tetratricopeptide repeat protein [Blastocatellia bacterium]